MSIKNPTLIITSVVLVGILSLLVWGLVSRATPAGDKAPDFQLTLLSGEQVTLSSINDKPIVLNFWAYQQPSSYLRTAI